MKIEKEDGDKGIKEICKKQAQLKGFTKLKI